MSLAPLLKRRIGCLGFPGLAGLAIAVGEFLEPEKGIKEISLLRRWCCKALFAIRYGNALNESTESVFKIFL